MLTKYIYRVFLVTLICRIIVEGTSLYHKQDNDSHSDESAGYTAKQQIKIHLRHDLSRKKRHLFLVVLFYEFPCKKEESNIVSVIVLYIKSGRVYTHTAVMTERTMLA